MQKTIAEINHYTSFTVNPLSLPEQTYELYSVPSYDSGLPEIIQGKEIGSTKVAVRENDVLVCKINPRINRVWVVKHHTQHPLIASSEWIVIRSPENDCEYLKWYFMSPKFHRMMVSQVTGIGGSLTRAQPKQVATYPVPIPDLPTQRRIATTLDKVSEGIALCKQMLADLDELVKSQFVELFGDPAKNSMGWPMKALGECLDSIGNGKSFVCESHSREGEFPAVLKLSAATTGTYQPDENKAVMDEDDFVDSAEVHDGDLLFTRKNTPELVGMAAYVFKTPPKLMMPDIVFRLNTDEKHCKKIYLWQLINHTMFRPCIQALANGSAKSMSNISKEKLMKLFIPVPDMDIQERFIDFFMQADKSKFAVQQQLMELETLKESLMQEYFG